MDKSAILVKRGVDIMKGRKTIAALIALAMVLSMTACKEGKGSDSNVKTTSQTTTTAETTVNKDAIAGDEVSLCNTVKLHSIPGMTGWIMKEGSKETGYYSKLENRTELLNLEFSLIDTKLINYDSADKSKMNNIKLDYKGKSVYCIFLKNEELEKIGLYRAIMMCVPVTEEKSLTMFVSVGGETMRKAKNVGKTEKWIVEHKDLYDSLTNDARDYLYLLDAVEFE